MLSLGVREIGKWWIKNNVELESWNLREMEEKGGGEMRENDEEDGFWGGGRWVEGVGGLLIWEKWRLKKVYNRGKW